MIPDTARRAITIPQLELILDHMRQRLAASTRMENDSHAFAYTPRYEGATERIITRIEEMNLYDCNTLLITPATKALIK